MTRYKEKVRRAKIEKNRNEKVTDARNCKYHSPYAERTNDVFMPFPAVNSVNVLCTQSGCFFSLFRFLVYCQIDYSRNIIKPHFDATLHSVWVTLFNSFDRIQQSAQPHAQGDEWQIGPPTTADLCHWFSLFNFMLLASAISFRLFPQHYIVRHTILTSCV